MASDSEASQTSRSRREDHPTTKHGLPFSNWEVLIGPSDWKDHSSGKDGAERYRVQNLPVSCSRPGIYEFAIAVTPSDDGRVIRNLDKVCTIPVYVGSAGDVRTRLQHYGRHGAHLDHGNSASALSGDESHHRQARPGLFEEIFERGYPILFRWAPVESRKEAEKKEAKLLDRYDYAWNKRGNGPSRRDEVLQVLDKRRTFCTGTCSSPGTRKGKEQASEKNPLRGGGTGSSRASPAREVEHPDDVFFYVPYRPRLVQEPRFSCLGNGASKEGGSTCRNRLVEGSKLRQDDGGRTGLITGTSGVILKEEELPVAERQKFDDYICGVIRGDGSLCRNPPEKGRRRCGVHKGQRVIGSALPESSPIRIEVGQPSSFCGVPLANGSICMESPVCGRKRCEDHKGRRITGASLGGGSDLWTTGFSVSSPFCGVTMNNGAPCMAAPVPGRMRCLRHKGRRI